MKTFNINKKIYYHDTDAGGVVYYANYFKYAEEARTDLLNQSGINLAGLNTKGIWFVVSHTEADYKYPARYNDTICVSSKITKVKSASLEFAQDILKEDRLLVRINTLLVCVDSSFKPTAMSSEIKMSLS